MSPYLFHGVSLRMFDTEKMGFYKSLFTCREYVFNTSTVWFQPSLAKARESAFSPEMR
jgi:hypothetical protein